MKRTVEFLTAPVEMNLCGDDIIEYADSCICLSIEDLGLNIERVTVIAPDQVSCVKMANKIMFDKNKGRTFTCIGVLG